MDEIEATQKIVSRTADMLNMAEQVLEEVRKRNGEEFSLDGEKPSIQDLVAVSSVIVSMSLSGMFKDKKPDDWIPPPGVIDAVLKQLEPVIEAKISLKMVKARIGAVPMPTPMSVPPVPTHPMPRPQVQARPVDVVPTPVPPLPDPPKAVTTTPHEHLCETCGERWKCRDDCKFEFPMTCDGCA